MHFGNGLIDTVFILLSLEAVVLNVINEFQKEHTSKSVMKLILKRFPSEKEEDSEANGSMNNEVHDHLVIEEHHGSWNIVTELLLDSLYFSFPGVYVGADH